MERYFAIIGLATHVILFALGWQLGKLIYPKSSKLRQLGVKSFKMKEDALSKNALLKSFARLVEGGNLSAASTLLFILIFLKSIGMLLAGIVGVTLPLMLFQAMMMYALFVEAGNRSFDLSKMTWVTMLQLLSHLSLGIIGNWLGYQYFVQGKGFHLLQLFDWPPFLVLLIISIVTAVLTARNETLFFKAHRALIG